MRFIPTCVGSMTFLGVKATAKSVHPHMCGEHVEDYGNAASKPVHPHMCGEHEFDEVLPVRQVGSSPHVWGALIHSSTPHGQHGSSPHVWGASHGCARQSERIAVHPHMCGEHTSSTPSSTPVFGSSPHVWGACSRHFIRHSVSGSSPHVWGASDHRKGRQTQRRFIPTCVGSICLALSSLW